MTPSGIEPATFWLVAQCLSQLRHRGPRCCSKYWIIFRQIRYGKVAVHKKSGVYIRINYPDPRLNIVWAWLQRDKLTNARNPKACPLLPVSRMYKLQTSFFVTRCGSVLRSAFCSSGLCFCNYYTNRRFFYEVKQKQKQNWHWSHLCSTVCLPICLPMTS